MKDYHIKRPLIILLSLLLFSQSILAGPLPDIRGESAFLMERSTGTILYTKNANIRRYPASTTKILTSILSIENLDLAAYISKSEDSIRSIPSDSSHIGLEVGDSFSILDGIHAVMLGSDNYVSHDLAINLDGSIDNFADRMNNKAREIGANNSNFVNPHGYHDPGHYTTAHDLGLIMDYAFKNNDFRNLVSPPNYILTRVNNMADPIKFDNTVQLVDPESPYYNPYALGGKTGFTKAAGRCLVAVAEKEDMELIGVVLKSTEKDLFNDMNNLFDYGFDNYKLRDNDENSYIINYSYSPWAKDIVRFSLINNLADNTMSNYQSSITKEDFIQLLMRTVYISQNKNLEGFSSESSIGMAIKLGIIPNDSYLSGLKAPITREDAAKLTSDLLRSIGYDPVPLHNPHNYKDEHLISQDNLPAIYYLQSRNIMGSIDEDYIYPKEHLTYEAALSIVNKLYKLYSTSPYSYINITQKSYYKSYSSFFNL
ncbi:MAG: D-alanyl-D-alanine carboxypeptidase [Epulopiscium sp.]|nr:D-alanyl-D-alanine carboxypeptidase [Candidatus Epulonipiscium sp.]